MSKFTNWFKSKKTIQQEQANAEALKKAEEIIKEKEVADALELEQKEIKEQAEKDAYIELKGIVEMPDGQIKIELDWGEGFITHLKQNGYTGVNDDAIIQKYILELSGMIAEDLGSDSDYE